MRVLLLQPPSPPGMNVARDYAGGFGIANGSPRRGYGHDSDHPVVPSLALAYSAAMLERHGHQVSFLDGQAEQLDLDGLMRRTEAISPEWIVSLLGLASLRGDLALLAEAKRRFPSAQVAGVGTVCRALTQEILQDGVVDCAVCGDPELVLPEVLSKWRPGDGPLPGLAVGSGDRIAISQDLPRVTDLDVLPSPAYHLLPLERYRHAYFGGEGYMTVLSSKGCPHACAYCPYPFGFGNRVAFASPARVADEIEQLSRRYGIRNILFRDQTFTLNAKHAEAICREILARDLRVRWVCETRLDSVTPDLLAAMRAAGCVRIHYGLESGDPDLFAAVGKPGSSIQQVDQVVAETLRAGIEAHLFVLVGMRGETWRTIRNTLRTLRRWRPSTVQVAVLTPYPGTPLFEEAAAKGLILTRDWSRYDGFQVVMATPQMTARDLARARRFLLVNYYEGKPLRRGAVWLRKLVAYSLDGSIRSRVRRRLAQRRAAATGG